MTVPLTPELLQTLEPLTALELARCQEILAGCHTSQLPADAAVPLGPGWLYLLHGELHITNRDGAEVVLVAGDPKALWPLSVLEAKVAHSLSEVELLHVDDQRVDVILTWDELAQRGTQSTAQAGMFQSLNVDLLTRGALAQLPPANIEALLQRFQPVAVQAGETLIREGAAGDYYYVLVEGRAEVTRQVGGIRLRLAELKAGDAAGEEALLNDDPRNATVTMLTAGQWLRLAKADFTSLLRAPLLQEIDQAEAEARVAAGQARWLDVRFPVEFRQGHLPGAINIPLGEIRHADQALDPAQPLIVYCRTGRRSAAAAFLLAQRGFATVCLRGGLQGQQERADANHKESA